MGEYGSVDFPPSVSVPTDGSDHLDGGWKTVTGTHEELLRKVPEYEKLFMEEGGAGNEEK